MSHVHITALGALALFWTPLATAFSQSAPPAREQVEAWVVELTELQIRLAPIEEQALQEPSLAREQGEVGDALLVAMIEADSTVEDKIRRLREILMEAQTLRDAERLEALGAEAQLLHPAIERARIAAMATPQMEARLAAFRESLHARMALIDPECPVLIARFQELERRIRSSVGEQGARQSSVPAR